MNHSDDEITRIETELAGLSGRARAMPLTRLAQACATAWWRAGTSTPAALAPLLKAIDALDEANGYFDQEDLLIHQVHTMIGIFLGVRYGVYNGATQDAERAIRLITGSRGATSVPPMQGLLAETVLGQTYMKRALLELQQGNVFAITVQGGPNDAVDDCDRATECFRVVIADSGAGPLGETAKMLLRLTETFRSIITPTVPGNFGASLDNMVQVLEQIRDLGQVSVGMGIPADLMDSERWLARTPRLDWPTAVVHGQEPLTDEPIPVAPAPIVNDIDLMRAELGKLFPDGDLRESMSHLLEIGEPPTWIDDFVALAMGVVHGGSSASAPDHVLLAAALYLRDRRDLNCRPAADHVAPSAEAIRTHLLAAADSVLTDDPDYLPTLLLLATLIADDSLNADVAQRLNALSVALREAGFDALVFPPPIDSLRWNATTGRLESATQDGIPGEIVFVGDVSAPVTADVVVASVASLTQLIELSKRPVRPITQRSLFIANPRGDHEWATVEAMLLRRSFYPRSLGFGRLLENSDGVGTSDEVRAALADVSLLHIGCGITDAGALELADTAELALAEISVSPGGLAILPPEKFQPLADILLAAGFSGVIGWQHPVPDAVAKLASFVLQVELVDRGRPAAEAVRAVRRWLLEPDLDILPHLLIGYADQLDDVDFADRMALVHRGIGK
jgi:hypothetical protein